MNGWMDPLIHSFILCKHYSGEGCNGSGAYSGTTGHEVQIQLGWDTSQLQQNSNPNFSQRV